jgi:hypothetical protein
MLEFGRIFLGVGRARAGGKRVQVDSANAHAAGSDAHCSEVAAVDPISDRLLVDLEQLGDLGDREVLVLHGRLSLTETDQPLFLPARIYANICSGA